MHRLGMVGGKGEAWGEQRALVGSNRVGAAMRVSSGPEYSHRTQDLFRGATFTCP